MKQARRFGFVTECGGNVARYLLYIHHNVPGSSMSRYLRAVVETRLSDLAWAQSVLRGRDRAEVESFINTYNSSPCGHDSGSILHALTDDEHQAVVTLWRERRDGGCPWWS